MAMKDLGIKENKIYDHPTSAQTPKVHYPSFDLPLDIIKGLELEVDDEVNVTISGRISGMQDTKWTKCVTIEAKEGEVTKKSKEEKK